MFLLFVGMTIFIVHALLLCIITVHVLLLVYYYCNIDILNMLRF